MLQRTQVENMAATVGGRLPAGQGSKPTVATGFRQPDSARRSTDWLDTNQMAPPRNAFEDHRRAIGEDDNGGGNSGDPMAPETLRIVFEADLGEGIAIGGGDD